jgi:hypothetical protein
LIRAAVVCALLSGAAMASPPAADSEAINAAIHKACRLSPAQARFHRSGGLDHLTMSPNMTYKQIKCASDAAEAAGAHLPHALVGKIS